MAQLQKKILDGHVETFLLSILEEGPSYGYAITKDLRERSDGLLKLGEGTIYPVLYRMEDRELIEAQWREGKNKRQRKYYRITPKGRKLLAENYSQWEMLVLVMKKLCEGGPQPEHRTLWKGA